VGRHAVELIFLLQAKEMHGPLEDLKGTMDHGAERMAGGPGRPDMAVWRSARPRKDGYGDLAVRTGLVALAVNQRQLPQ
jgi:hypothetical protein